MIYTNIIYDSARKVITLHIAYHVPLPFHRIHHANLVEQKHLQPLQGLTQHLPDW